MENSRDQLWNKVDRRKDKLNPGEGAAQPSPTGSEDSPFSLIGGEEELEERIDLTTGPVRDRPRQGEETSRADMSSDEETKGDKPTTPLMGGLRETSKGTYTAWCGGIPKHDWSGLLVPETKEKKVLVTPSMYRSTSVTSQAKAYVYRSSGLEEKFHKDADRQMFYADVMARLKDTGLDTITYLPDPVDNNKMISVVNTSARFSVESATKLVQEQLKKYDEYDLENDKAAVSFLLKSLETSLKKKVMERMSNPEECFPIVWMKFLKII